MHVKAVFDIGKTNKKFLLFDDKFNVVHKQQTTLVESEDGDGDPCEDLDQLVRWMKQKFDAVTASDQFRITSLNFSAYGASLVHLDENGEVATPLYNYLKSYPEDLLETFYDAYGGKERFSLETASPPMGMLNSGLQLYWLKHRKPSLYKKISCSLHFPQYLSYLFTGETGAECTSIGCHTGMWNFKDGKYHRWLEEEGMAKILPPVEPVDKTFRLSRNGESFKVGMGIHDSSAALVPYLYLFENPFLLVSTGTWSISLNPFNGDPLTFEELQKDCLCYMNIFGDQVKASRLFLGNEYAYQKQKMDEHFLGKSTDHKVELDFEMLTGLIENADQDRKLILEAAQNTGPYPESEAGEWKIDGFSSYKEAYHQLMLDLISIQADSIELAQGSETVNTLVLTGGFGQNDFFVKLLASRFPAKKVFTTTQPHASALGAAMVLEDHRTFDNEALKEVLNLTQHEPLPGTGIETYRWKPSASVRSNRSGG